MDNIKTKDSASYLRKVTFSIATPFALISGMTIYLPFENHYKLVLITLSSLFFINVAMKTLKRTVTQPLMRVSAAAKEMTNGTFKDKQQPVIGGEIGALWNSMHSMYTSLKKQSKQVESLAFFDDLTPLNNKHAFLSHIRKLDNNESSKVAAWVIDIDDFKRINNIYGYDVGNKVLIEFGRRLKDASLLFERVHNLGKDNFLVARDSADEFLVFSNQIRNTQLAEVFASSIHMQLNTPVIVDGRELNVSCFVGWDAGTDSGFDIYQNATMAMHDAKKNRLPSSQFNQTLLENIHARQELSDNIKRALDTNEFILHYQPKCKINSNKIEIKEYEALIRWTSKDGFISPGVFIPFAEEANLISYIDMWVCEQVIKDVKHLEQNQPDDFSISFNVSGSRISDPKFLSSLSKWIDEYQINPAHLQIEITEHTLIDNTQNSIESILALKNLGVSVALDDFGTGYCSLGYLKDLPIDTLKIDRCFVSDINFDESKRILLKHIISIGQDLGLKMVAEGVETVYELETLRLLNCDMAQGFHLYKPMPMSNIIELSKENIAA